jgi:hypothetical protein
VSSASRQRIVENARQELITRAGGYLRNVIREANMTCQVCCTPVDGYQRCAPCNGHWREHGARLANLVVPLSYAVSGQQSGLVLRQYKDNPRAEVRRNHSVTVSRALFYGLVKHERCIEAFVGAPVDVRIAVPSLSGRAGLHPLTGITDAMQAATPDCRLMAMPGSSSTTRDVSEPRFYVTPADGVRGAHVLVIDDTWTSGSRTQSAALTLRSSGAARVTILTVSRWLEPSFGSTAQFIRSRLVSDYDPDRCPVTGDRCPR